MNTNYKVFYDMAQATDTTLIDTSGNNLNASSNLLKTKGFNGKEGRATVGLSSGFYLSGALNSSSNFTLNVKFKLDNLAGTPNTWQAIFCSLIGTHSRSIGIGIRTGNEVVIQRYTGSHTEKRTGVYIKNSDWNMYTLVVQESLVSLYLNGSKIGEEVATHSIGLDLSSSYYPAQSDRQYVTGTYDEIALWEEVLSESEIKEIAKAFLENKETKEKFAILKNPENDKVYSFSEGEVYEILTERQLYEHGLDSGKTHQLEQSVDKVVHILDTPILKDGKFQYEKELSKPTKIHFEKNKAQRAKEKTLINWYELDMTSNTTPTPYVVTSSNAVATAGSPYAIFAQRHRTANGHWDSGLAQDAWVQIDLSTETPIDIYTLGSNVMNANTHLMSMPKNFELRGSNNGIDFDVVHSVTDARWGNRDLQKIFRLNNKVSYRYYRLHVYSSQGETNIIRLGFLRLGARKE